MEATVTSTVTISVTAARVTVLRWLKRTTEARKPEARRRSLVNVFFHRESLMAVIVCGYNA